MKRKTLRQKDLDRAEGQGQPKVRNLCKEEGEWLHAEGGCTKREKEDLERDEHESPTEVIHFPVPLKPAFQPKDPLSLGGLSHDQS